MQQMTRIRKMNPTLLCALFLIGSSYFEKIFCQQYVFQAPNTQHEILPGIYAGDFLGDLTATLSEIHPVFLYASSPGPLKPQRGPPRKPLLDSGPTLTFGFVPSGSTSTSVTFKPDPIEPAPSLRSSSKVRVLSALGDARPLNQQWTSDAPQRGSRRPVAVSYGRDANGNYVPVSYYDGTEATRSGPGSRFRSESELRPRPNPNHAIFDRLVPKANSERNVYDQKASVTAWNDLPQYSTPNWKQNNNGQRSSSSESNTNTYMRIKGKASEGDVMQSSIATSRWKHSHNAPKSATNTNSGVFETILPNTNSEQRTHAQKTPSKIGNQNFHSNVQSSTNWKHNHNSQRTSSSSNSGVFEVLGLKSEQNAAHNRNVPTAATDSRSRDWESDHAAQYREQNLNNYKIPTHRNLDRSKNSKQSSQNSGTSSMRDPPSNSDGQSSQPGQNPSDRKDSDTQKVLSLTARPQVWDDQTSRRILLIKATTLVTTQRPSSAPFVSSSFRTVPQSAPRPEVNRLVQTSQNKTDASNSAKEDSPYILDVPDSDLYYQVKPSSPGGVFDAEGTFQNTSKSYLSAQSISSSVSVSVNLNDVTKKDDKPSPKKSGKPKKKSKAVLPSSEEPDEVPGIPGQDYPTYYEIPTTNFKCKDSTTPGFYADLDTGCQVFHNCDTRGQKHSFLCPNGTVFRQELFICDWWYNVRCDHSQDHYTLNGGLFPRPH